MSKIEGGCLCGNLRYSSEAEPVMQVICHCKTCQKVSGSAYSLNVGVPEDSLVVNGDSLSTYEDHSGASGQAFFRKFCSKCGSHVFSHGPAYGAVAFIKAGTLDDPSWIDPTLHIWCDEKIPCVEVPAGATQAAGNPG